MWNPAGGTNVFAARGPDLHYCEPSNTRTSGNSRKARAQKEVLTEKTSLLDRFAQEYNHRRPHRSLQHHATPATIYTSRPKATPSNRTENSHNRVRRDRIDSSGKITLRYQGQLYSIGIGRTHARTRVLLLIQDLHIQVINAQTSELLRNLILDPTKRYQPTGRPPGPPPRK